MRKALRKSHIIYTKDLREWFFAGEANNFSMIESFDREYGIIKTVCIVNNESHIFYAEDSEHRNGI